MSSVNNVILSGRLGKDPEMKYVPSGKPVTHFPLAVNEAWKNGEGQPQERTTWVNIECWNGTGEAVARYLTKGRLVLVEGKLRIDPYEQDGQTKYYTKIVASSVQFLDWPKEQAPIAEDIPF